MAGQQWMYHKQLCGAAGVSRSAAVQPGPAGVLTIGARPQAFAFGAAQQVGAALGAERDAPADPAP